jgi:hypothetical protein
MQFLENFFFLRFGKKITRVPVVKHRNDIKIQIVHQTINLAKRVYGENFSLLRRTVWLLHRGQTDRIPEFNTSLIGRGKKQLLINIYKIIISQPNLYHL